MSGTLVKTPHKHFPLPIKAVVIDLDGTLLDTATDLAEAANNMLAELDRPPVGVDVLKTYIGNGVTRLVKRALTRNEEEEPDDVLLGKAIPAFERYYARNVSKTSRPFPGVVEGLQALRAAGFRLACVTNKTQRFTLPLLEDTGLLDYFELVLSGDSLPRKKPDPLPLVHASQHFGIDVGNLLLIGDSLNDTQAARAAGCPVFCVPYGYNRGRDVGELDLDAVVPTLRDALPMIRLV
jgi:phosphoglycolate phosphatase